MSRLVQDLLVLARADGGVEVDRTALDLTSVVGDVVGQARRLYAHRQVRADLQPATVDGNADALRQMLWILLDNAFSHTGDGGQIRIVLETIGARVRMTVADDGEGIPEGTEERIFERFFQADASRARSGAGLGLSIARWLVEQHGGSISASNNEGGGAIFSVELPSAPSVDARVGIAMTVGDAQPAAPAAALPRPSDPGAFSPTP
jgi:signal transduction histidine kinase